MEKRFTEAELNLRAKAYYDNHFNHVLHAHIDIAGDLVAGTLLSRVLWWFAPTPQGKSKLRVFKDGYYWLVKSREDWWDEIRISPKQYDRAIKVLEQKNLIIKKLYKFDGNPTTHIRPNYEQLESEIEKWLNDIKDKMLKGEIDEKGRKSNSPKGKKPEESRLEPDSSQDDAPNAGVEPHEYQGESPNPLKTLVFTERGKTDSTEGEERNQPNGEIFNREYHQGKQTGKKDDDDSAPAELADKAAQNKPWEANAIYQQMRQAAIAYGEKINSDEKVYALYLTAAQEYGEQPLLVAFSTYLTRIVAGEHKHKKPQIAWFLGGGYNEFTHAGQRKQAEPRKQQRSERGEKLPKAVEAQMERQQAQQPPVIDEEKSQESIEEKRARIERKLADMRAKLSTRNANEENVGV